MKTRKATVRQGLELVAADKAYERLRALRGKVKFSIDLKTLREDVRLPMPGLRRFGGRTRRRRS